MLGFSRAAKQTPIFQFCMTFNVWHLWQRAGASSTAAGQSCQLAAEDHRRRMQVAGRGFAAGKFFCFQLLLTKSISDSLTCRHKQQVKSLLRQEVQPWTALLASSLARHASAFCSINSQCMGMTLTPCSVAAGIRSRGGPRQQARGLSTRYSKRRQRL